MVEPKIRFVKAKKEDKCPLCDTFVEKGEKCMEIYSPRKNIYNNIIFDNAVKVHIGCIESFIEEIRIALKDELLRELK